MICACGKSCHNSQMVCFGVVAGARSKRDARRLGLGQNVVCDIRCCSSMAGPIAAPELGAMSFVIWVEYLRVRGLLQYVQTPEDIAKSHLDAQPAALASHSDHELEGWSRNRLSGITVSFQPYSQWNQLKSE